MDEELQKEIEEAFPEESRTVDPPEPLMLEELNEKINDLYRQLNDTQHILKDLIRENQSVVNDQNKQHANNIANLQKAVAIITEAGDS